ncbi:MAG TPA: sodium ABC transporter ATP-binding protein [Planctomycetaceae bacterium]|nr:sodium ABC transporter ATP-binding protein [Planctomycetaceae bacterium]
MIVAEQLTREFRTGGQSVLAVDHLSFSVDAGEVYGLLGPNGAGKTTTMRMVLGLLAPSSGDSHVSGFRVTEHPDEVKRRIGFVSASVGVYPWLSPREVLAFVADLYEVNPDQVADRTQRLAELLDIADILDQRSATLSTGQKQRVNLARALIHEPPVMLMDEPTRGLDVVGSQVIFDYIEHLKAEGKAVIVCTHRLDEAERFCDRFGLLHQGVMRHEGTLTELRTKTGHQTLTEMFLELLSSSATEEVT